MYLYTEMTVEDGLELLNVTETITGQVRVSVIWSEEPVWLSVVMLVRNPLFARGQESYAIDYYEPEKYAINGGSVRTVTFNAKDIMRLSVKGSHRSGPWTVIA